MVEIASTYATKVGQLVVNLARRPYTHVTLRVADTVLNSNVLSMRIAMIKNGKSANIEETLTEAAIEEMSDVAVVADAIINKLVKQL